MIDATIGALATPEAVPRLNRTVATIEPLAEGARGSRALADIQYLLGTPDNGVDTDRVKNVSIRLYSEPAEWPITIFVKG